MAAAVTLLGTQTFNTTSGTHTVTATPVVNDLIVLIIANTGNLKSIAPTDNNSDGNGTYANITSALKGSNSDTLDIWVRNSRIGSATSTVFTQAAGTSTGGGLAVIKVTGISVAGLLAIRQSAVQSNKASGGTPTPVFSKAPLTTSAIIGAVFNATNPATMTPRSSPAYTERVDVGYATPTTGLEIMSIDSGDTATSIAWGGTSASAFCSAVIEVTINTAPTVALNSPADVGTVNSITPQMQLTGTDSDSDAIRYQVQIDTVNTFDSISDSVQVADSNSEINADGADSVGTGSTYQGVGQSFIGKNGILDNCQFFLDKVNSPTGNAVAKIYTHSGGYGATSIPTGAALATSDNFDVSTLTATPTLSTFNFSGANRISLADDTKYVVTIEYSGGDASNNLAVNSDNTTPHHGGNASGLFSGSWIVNGGGLSTGEDLCFYVNIVPKIPKINKISGQSVGFTDITNGAHTDPFTSGEQIGLTVQNSGSTIAIDSVSSGRNSTGNITVSHTTASGNDRMLIVLTTAQDSNHSNMPVTGITYNGKALNKLRSDEAAGNNRTEIWYLIAPDVGTFNVIVTHKGSIGESTCGVISLTGVKQFAPEANNGSSGNSVTPSVSLTTVASNAFTISIASAEATFSTINNGQTVLSGYPLTDQSYENADAASNTISSPGATTLSYTISSGQSWAISAVSLAPAGLDSLTNSTTYYWRVRGKDPSGSDIYGAWSSTRSFTVTLASSLVNKVVNIAQAIRRASYY